MKGTAVSILKPQTSQPYLLSIGTHMPPLNPPLSTLAGGVRCRVRMVGSRVPRSGGAGAASEPRQGARGCVQAGRYIQSGRGCACSHAREPSHEQEP